MKASTLLLASKAFGLAAACRLLDEIHWLASLGSRRARKPEYDAAWEPFLSACALGAPSADLDHGIVQGWTDVAWSHEGYENPGPLHLAAKAPDLHALRALLDAGADMERLDEHGFTALGSAGAAGTLAAMEELLALGADPAPRAGRSALGAACERGQVEAAKRLAAFMRLDPARRRDRSAAQEGLFWACHGSASLGMRACVELMLALGADPNRPGLGDDPPLFWACDAGEAGAIRALLAAGADARALRPFDGSTVFMWAARNLASDPEVFRLVARHGSRLDGARRDGRSALMFAAHGGMEECMEAALAAGGDPFAADADGATALHFAALSGSLPCVERLLALGAPIDVADSQKCWTPMWRATQSADPAIRRRSALSRRPAAPQRVRQGLRERVGRGFAARVGAGALQAAGARRGGSHLGFGRVHLAPGGRPAARGGHGRGSKARFGSARGAGPAHGPPRSALNPPSFWTDPAPPRPGSQP